MPDIVPPVPPDDRPGKPDEQPPATSVESPTPRNAAVRDRFRRQKTRDTAPELALRRRLHALGLRYRVDYPVLPGRRRRPDIVFTRVRVAVFVDGCFWHRCPQHAIAPKNNAGWWAAKLERTVERDAETDRLLHEADWLPVHVWEHESPAQAADRIHRLLRERRS